MPELPDVEVFRGYLEATSLHQRIKSVKIDSGRVIKGISEWELKAGLEGHLFKAGRRHGKYLFAELDNSYCLVLHFGMTGYLKYFRRADKRPEHERLVIDFKNGYHLSYDSQRKLGEIHLAKDPEDFIAEKGLGPDALDPGLDLSVFRDALGGGRGTVKSTLMNQKRIAGIGNVYSDEILFQAGIHPKMQNDRLVGERPRKLFESMKEVLNTAVDCRADPEQFPNSYLIPRRKKDGECPKCGTRLKKISVSGRSSYYCAQCQPEA
ncbi:MAG: Fpg/Nei family DNA glycosylase [Desulfatiglandales bacterium]